MAFPSLPFTLHQECRSTSNHPVCLLIYLHNVECTFYKYSSNILQIFYRCSTNILQLFYRYSTNIYFHNVECIFFKYSTDILKIFIFTMWYIYSTNILQVLYKYRYSTNIYLHNVECIFYKIWWKYLLNHDSSTQLRLHWYQTKHFISIFSQKFS